MSDEEDKYIKQTETDQIARIRRERMLAALRQEEREGIAAVLHTDEAVAEEAMELGFDRSTARVLHLVPLIQMAWADDSVQEGEREEILKIADQNGIERGTPAYEFLELLLAQRPTDLFFERTNRVIRHLLANNATGAEAETLIEQARAVAEAAGGIPILGLNKISKEERDLIDKFANIFKL